MKVAHQESLLYKIEQRAIKTKGKVFLFRDVANLTKNKSQISRALWQLVKKGKLIKISCGVFAKAQYSERLNRPILDGNPKTIFLEALTRLNIKWELGKFTQDYNAGRSTQVPVNDAIKLKTRTRRKIAYRGMQLRYE